MSKSKFERRRRLGVILGIFLAVPVGVFAGAMTPSTVEASEVLPIKECIASGGTCMDPADYYKPDTCPCVCMSKGINPGPQGPAPGLRPMGGTCD